MGSLMASPSPSHVHPLIDEIIQIFLAAELERLGEPQHAPELDPDEPTELEAA